MIRRPDAACPACLALAVAGGATRSGAAAA